MLVSNQEQLRAFNHVAQEILALRKPAGEFFRRIHGGIHLTPEFPFRFPDGRNQIGKSHIVRDYHEVQIAFRSFCTARHGTKNERNVDSVCDGLQSLLQNLSDPECLAHESAEFLKDRTAMIGLVIGLSAFRSSDQYFGSP